MERNDVTATGSRFGCLESRSNYLHQHSVRARMHIRLIVCRASYRYHHAKRR